MEKTLSQDGTPIAFRRQGAGPSVVLVTGALSTAATDDALAALLAPRFTVFRYDRRGRGSSGDTAPYAVEREVEDLAAVLAQAGGRAGVYGMSSGAALVLRAVAAGLPVDRVAVYEPPYDLDPASRAAAAPDRARLRELVAAGDRTGALELFLTGTGMPPEMLDQMRRAPMWPGLQALAPTLAYDYAVMGDGEPPLAGLAAVARRTLVISGGASPEWMRSAARAVADAVPRARHRTLTGQTHEVAPQVLAPVLTDFFAGTEAPLLGLAG
ncbi:alpha/beta fold hydrolase [Streptomyces sp. NPDC050504]|uniref:alpha/beta fold hydrolase n=1 Tax=Streptomyces sp. NPDC050504 TaxID=3365618 RepID=UPI0037AA46C8